MIDFNNTTQYLLIIGGTRCGLAAGFGASVHLPVIRFLRFASCGSSSDSQLSLFSAFYRLSFRWVFVVVDLRKENLVRY